mmetsp:Transcript_114976/g.256721  ORF Transcript_114976/g.256721 Transcript_114976/m.256721 type:complete len:212 (-) Transcript_114976:414-1049(-)
MHGPRHLLRHAEQGSACVEDGMATAISAFVEDLVSDVDGLDLHLPISELRRDDRHPLQSRGGIAGVMAAEGDRALAFVGLGHVDCKVRQQPRGLLSELAEEAELGRQGQGAQSQAEHAVKGEEAKGLVGHLVRKHDAELRAITIRRRPQAHGVLHKLAQDLPSAEGNVELVPLYIAVRLDGMSLIVDVHRALGGVNVVAPVLLACIILATH